MSGDGLNLYSGAIKGGAHDAERRAVYDAKANLAHRRRRLTRFDDYEDNTWLDPDRSGPRTVR